jgi:hypothetical protein
MQKKCNFGRQNDMNSDEVKPPPCAYFMFGSSAVLTSFALVECLGVLNVLGVLDDLSLCCR